MLPQNETRLTKIIASAQAIRSHLAEMLSQSNGQVHFRPTTNGVTMVSLLDTSPQLGHGPYDAARLAADFTAQFARYCLDAPNRPTPEKQVQSYLIADAYRHDRHMTALGAGRVLFVTDELALFQDDGRKVVCDILAFRPDVADPSQGVPVLIELKSARQMTRLLEQLRSYAQEMARYTAAFERLYSAVFGRDIHFTAPPERWLVWPAAGDMQKVDPRATELSRQGIHVVQYAPRVPPFQFVANPM